MLRPSNLAAPDTALNCCEGDILLLLDSSGSVSAYEFMRLLLFLVELLRPFSLGRGHVRVGLLQVDTEPHLEFGLGTHGSQPELRAALLNTRQLGGDTNTVPALGLARELLSGAGEHAELPKVLLWLTDGVRLGDVDQRMSELKGDGVAVLALVTGQGDYQTLRRSVTPPLESHLYFVDIDDIRIVMEDLREAIIEIIRAERLRVVHLLARGAVLQWRPVLTTHTGYYRLQYQCVGSISTTGCGATAGRPRSLIISGDSSWAELRDLRPDATYTASLTPTSNHDVFFSTLSVTFTTLPELLGPAVVSVLDSGPHQIHVSWGPLQPERVQGYRVEYAALPSGHVRTVAVNGHHDSTVLAELEPDTQYLVTVTALFFAGAEKAMSVKACTQEVAAPLPALEELLLTPLDGTGIEVKWRVHSGQHTLRGYWLSWEVETSAGLSASVSSMHVNAGTVSARLAHVAAIAGRVCVSPIYSAGRGDGLCCTTAERLQSSPSAEHGLTSDAEEQLRMRGCELIQAAGILLKLPQVAMATGQILFQRFFYCKSFVRHCAEMVAMACVHLSSKIEEEPRRIRDVINVFHHLKKGRGGRTRPPLPLDAAYVNTKAQVIKTERRVLKELGFCVHVKHPHKASVIVMYLQVLECEKNTPLVQMAWNYMNDSLRTDVFLRYSAETVACACIYLSARALQIPLPEHPAWFLLFGSAEEDLKEICRRILRLYALPSVSLAALLLQVDKCRQAMDALAAKAKAAGTVLLSIGTPTLDSPANFSPASKAAASPSEVGGSHTSAQRRASLCAYRVIEGGIGGQLCFRHTQLGFHCGKANCRTVSSLGSLVANILTNGSVLLQWTNEGVRGRIHGKATDVRTGQAPNINKTGGDGNHTSRDSEMGLTKGPHGYLTPTPRAAFSNRPRRRSGVELSCWWNGSYTQFECAAVHLGSSCRDFMLTDLHENVPYRICLRTPAHSSGDQRDCVEFTISPSGMQDIVIAMTTVGGAICVMLVIICLLVAYITENIMSPATNHTYSYHTHSRH
ncbi:unnamed protein product [Lota lota]